MRVKSKPTRALKRVQPDEQKITKIAKRVIKASAETKSYVSAAFTLSPLDDQLAVCNLIYPMAQGTGSANYTGEQIWLKNIHIKGRIYSNQGASTVTNAKLIRVTVFRTKKAITNSTTSAATLTDLFRNTPLALASSAHVDFTKVKLLYDQSYVMTPQLGTAGGTQTQVLQKLVDINVPINKKEYFDADNSGYLMYSNIYVAFTAYDGNGIVAPCALNFSWSVNFKDM